MDLVLTTREMGRLINADRIKTDELEEAPFDDSLAKRPEPASYSVRPAVLWSSAAFGSLPADGQEPEDGRL